MPEENVSRFWISPVVGIAVGGQNLGGHGDKNTAGGNYGWNFAGLAWFFLAGVLFGFDIIKKKFGLFFSPVLMIGGSVVLPGLGFGVSIGRRLNLGLIIPIEVLTVVIGTTLAAIGSIIIGALLVIGVIALIWKHVK
jgi:hypothetical protein